MRSHHFVGYRSPNSRWTKENVIAAKFIGWILMIVKLSFKNKAFKIKKNQKLSFVEIIKKIRFENSNFLFSNKFNFSSFYFLSKATPTCCFILWLDYYFFYAKKNKKKK